jgi:hypothetical protein
LLLLLLLLLVLLLLLLLLLCTLPPLLLIAPIARNAPATISEQWKDLFSGHSSTAAG